MIYRNDDIEIKDNYVKGKIKDIMEYFRYEIASQSMSGSECDYDNYLLNIHYIVDVLDNLQEDLENDIKTESDIVIVKEHYMGGFVIESEEE